MGKITGFMEYPRLNEAAEPVEKRLKHYHEFICHLPDQEAAIQGARCMDCGPRFCQTGCPVNNIIPDWSDLVYRGNWKRAIESLHSTDNFPDFPSRICPAPCEAACTLNINSDPVTIRAIERAIIDKAWEMDWVQPQPPKRKTGKRTAVIGAGPAGMACAQQLARDGHDVVVYEKSDRIGGLLRYGIPDFKMEKRHIDRRIEQMSAEGVEFRLNQHIGVNVSAKILVAEFDAVVLAGGAESPRDLPLPGRDLKGIHFAMGFLRQQNKVIAGDVVPDQIKATGKHVVVIGGGDTGSDCIGTSNRQNAAIVTQLELLPQPPVEENKPLTWPYWPMKLRSSSSHDEGCSRDWSVATKAFIAGEGKDCGKLKAIKAVRLQWIDGKMSEVPGSEFTLKADLAFLAMGFLGPVGRVLDAFGVARDARSNARADTEAPGALAYATSVAKVFAAGDMRRGQSLVVWAIREGRQCARAVDEYLMGTSLLPR